MSVEIEFWEEINFHKTAKIKLPVADSYTRFKPKKSVLHLYNMAFHHSKGDLHDAKNYLQPLILLSIRNAFS